MSAPITLAPSEYQRTVPMKPLSDWEDVVREEEAKSVTLLGPMIFGFFVLFIGVGGFLIWANMTEVAQASSAPGKIVVQSNTKTVTHLEGGTLKSVKVSEGMKVKQGELLAALDVTRNQATLFQLRQQLLTWDVKLARLIAEKDGNSSFVFDKKIPAGIEEDVAAQLISIEQKLLQERRTQFADQISVDQSSIEQLDSQADALIARQKSSKEQLDFIGRDYQARVQLEKKQYATKTSVYEKKMQMVEMESRIAETAASIAENKQRRSQAVLNLANRRTDYLRSISEQMQQAQSEIGRIRQDIISAEYTVATADIRAPQDGIVANIKVKTAGSAVMGGQPIMDIVPDNQPLQIEGKAKSSDIDSIHVGQKAEVRLAAFGAAEALPLAATITYIAADAIIDERSGEYSYPIKAKINDGELKKQPNLFLYPGMTADISIVNGNRTALTYLLLPIQQSFRRAFREQ